MDKALFLISSFSESTTGVAGHRKPQRPRKSRRWKLVVTEGLRPTLCNGAGTLSSRLGQESVSAVCVFYPPNARLSAFIYSVTPKSGRSEWMDGWIYKALTLESKLQFGRSLLWSLPVWY